MFSGGYAWRVVEHSSLLSMIVVGARVSSYVSVSLCYVSIGSLCRYASSLSYLRRSVGIVRVQGVLGRGQFVYRSYDYGGSGYHVLDSTSFGFPGRQVAALGGVLLRFTPRLSSSMLLPASSIFDGSLFLYLYLCRGGFLPWLRCGPCVAVARGLSL